MTWTYALPTEGHFWPVFLSVGYQTPEVMILNAENTEDKNWKEETEPSHT